MEEPIQMKLLHVAAVAASLWLAGCATPPADTSAGVSPPAAKASEPAAATQSSAVAAPSVIPGGPLKPIAAADLSSQGVAPLEPPADLWDRIRRGFAMPNLDGDLVRQQEQWYVSRPDYIQRMTERSRKYLFHVVEELERRNMPTELALLPFIESAFNPQAVSSARAAGMWQFMPATGKDYELKQNVFRDDRRDVLASTRAALDYLQKLYGMFGDWHLALAAYNWGEGNVARAVARNQRAGLGTSYKDLNMPNETRNYVPKLQAVKNIVASPEGLHAELPLIGDHPYFQTVTLTRDMDVALIARLADVSVDDFKALNPSTKRPVVLAAGTGQVLLPWDNATVFRRNFDAYNAGQFASWTAWSAPSTMTAAEAARRVGMSEADLRSVNAIPPRMLIKGGSVLIVPRTARMNQDVADNIADNGQLTLAPEIVARRTTVKAGRRDSVASIARRYRLNPTQVAEWNQLGATASFKPGQRVVLFLPVRSVARVPARMVRTASTSAPAARKTGHVARTGHSTGKHGSKGKRHR
jgi:membrane-bound lytic murein transglycosylase D